MFCPKCGVQVNSPQSFCSQCGAALNENSSPSQNTNEIASTKPLKNKKPLIIGVIAILLFLIGISLTIRSCANNPAKLIVGKWTAFDSSSGKSDGVGEFTKDGKVISEDGSETVTYKIDKSDKENIKLTIYLDSKKNSSREYKIKFKNKDEFELTEPKSPGEVYTFKRVKK